MAQFKKESAVIGVLILAAILGAWRFIWQPANKPSANQEATPVTEVVPTTPNAGLVEGSEKVTAVKTSYKNPGGSDEVGYVLSVNEEGVITKATVEVLAKNPISIQRQNAFAQGLPAAIQGKKLSELSNIDKVGGSSLTTASFNASLAQLKAGI